ncbi:MAG: hypothetical protein FJX80_16095 [Bacteroidetes bacterium]|nr:hypothetical protein [Bacteroidota bacterium]
MKKYDKKGWFTREGTDEEVKACREKMRSMRTFVSFVDYTYCTETSGVEVQFSQDFNFLHFKGKKVDKSRISLKKDSRLKVRLNVADVIGILMGPESLTF